MPRNRGMCIREPPQRHRPKDARRELLHRLLCAVTTSNQRLSLAVLEPDDIAYSSVLHVPMDTGQTAAFAYDRRKGACTPTEVDAAAAGAEQSRERTAGQASAAEHRYSELRGSPRENGCFGPAAATLTQHNALESERRFTLRVQTSQHDTDI